MSVIGELQRAGVNKYDQILAFCGEREIESFFYARHAKILLHGAPTDADIVDIVIYVLDPPTKTASTKINIVKAPSVIVVVNKMYTISIRVDYTRC
jgi:hypothetical protein